jgi:hypothetical protein
LGATFILRTNIGHAIGLSPEGTDIWHTVSNGSTSNQGSNLLFSPKVNLKIVSSKNGGFQIAMIGGGQCNDGSGYDSGSSGQKVTEYRVRATDDSGNIIFGNPIVRVNNGGGCSQKNITLNIPAGKSQKLKSKGFEGKYAFYVSAEILNASPTTNGYLNVFKAAVVPDDGATDIGAAQSEQGDRPVAFLGRPNDSVHANDKHNYYLKFGTKCDLAASSKIRLSWFDADANTIYQDNTIYFQVVDKTNGSNVVLKDERGRSRIAGSDLGGEASSGSAVYTFEPGHQYEWQWRNVTNSNGVQVNYPFDAVNYVTDCPTASPDAGRCEPGNGSAISVAPDPVSPGQKDVNFTIKIKNTGTTTWKASDHYVYITNTAWKDLSSKFNNIDLVNGQVIKFLFGNYPPNTILTLKFSATAPTSVVDGSSSFAVLIYSGDPTASRPTPPTEGLLGGCSRDIDVVENRPYLRVSGSDTVAGASFTGSGITNIYGAKNAPIETNGVDENSGSSSGQYAVTASGFIDSLAPANFYSNNYQQRSSRKDLSFANDGIEQSPDEYGKFYGDDGVGLPDVDITQLESTAKESSPASNNINDYLKNDKGSAYFKGNTTLTGGAIKGSKIIDIEGDVTISGDLTYSADSNLILLVKGNIYINSSVSQIDGTYIAFPTSANNGLVDTCSNVGGAGDWPDSGKALTTEEPCNNKLTVNGRLIASKVLWKRTFGTIGNNSNVINGTCAAGDAPKNISKLESCAAEFIDFSPEAYFNSPFNTTYKSAISNVPISTLELPPIY